MQVALERLANSMAKVSVTVNPEDVNDAMNKAFRSVVNRYNIPGFRRGKAPRNIFERYVGRGVLLHEAAQQIVENRYREALREANVEPVGEPQINIVTLEDGQPFSFDIQVESKPDIEIEDLSDLWAIPLTLREKSEDELQAELQNVAKSQAQLVPADEEPVAMGNRIVMGLKGYVEDDESGEPFVEDDAYSVEVGAGMTVEGLDNQLIGLKVGEPATLRLTYPENHPDVSLAGKAVRFEVTVTENKRHDVPPIDDELAKALGYENEQELRETVANRLQNRLDAQAKNDRLADMMGKLKERVPFDLPGVLVDQAIHKQLYELENTLVRMGADLEQYIESRQITPDALHEEMRPKAEDRVREELLLEAIAKKLEITATDEEVIESIRPLADAYQQPLSDVVNLFKKQGEFEGLRRNLLISKTGDYLANKVTD